MSYRPCSSIEPTSASFGSAWRKWAAAFAAAGQGARGSQREFRSKATTASAQRRATLAAQRAGVPIAQPLPTCVFAAAAHRAMRAKTLQIVWHGKEPVYSVDFHPDGTLVTGGQDKEIKVWQVMRSGCGWAFVMQALGSATTWMEYHGRNPPCWKGRCCPGPSGSGGGGAAPHCWL